MKTRFILLTITSIISMTLFGQTAPDRPAVHGMLVFGTQKVYLSHLPMFLRPHDYQAIFEAEFAPENLKKYLDDKRTHPETKYYTLEPEPFVLPAMAASPRPFLATLYRGHFERGGTAILESIKVTPKKVYFSKLDPQAPRPLLLSFLLFGNKTELFLAHLISGRGNFDQVLETRFSERDIKERIQKGEVLSVEFPDSNDASPLLENPNEKFRLKGNTERVSIMAAEIYREIEELK